MDKLQQYIQIAMAVVTLLSMVSAILNKKTVKKLRSKLPSWIDTWLDVVTLDQIYDALEEADKFVNMTPTQRRNKAVEIIRSKVSFEIPTSVANYLVEIGYQLWRGGVKAARSKANGKT